MNPKHRFYAVIVLTFLSISGLGAETVIDQLYGLRNYELADAYWAAGQKFTDLGQADRGQQFKNQAKHLFPGYVPGQAPAFQAVPAAVPATPEPKVPEASAVREQNLQGEKLTRLQFQKLLRGYLTGSAKTVLAVLGDSVEVQGQVSVPSLDTLTSFFESQTTEAGSPEDLFLTDSLEVTDGLDQQVLVKVTANPQAPAELAAGLPFWKPTQTYTFDRVGDTWKLFKIEGN